MLARAAVMSARAASSVRLGHPDTRQNTPYSSPSGRSSRRSPRPRNFDAAAGRHSRFRRSGRQRHHQLSCRQPRARRPVAETAHKTHFAAATASRTTTADTAARSRPPRQASPAPPQRRTRNPGIQLVDMIDLGTRSRTLAPQNRLIRHQSSLRRG